ncbi:hypothetical protein LCGC14_2862120 [marine sediment metagenome]|uniref:Uncharacterized protein n=1 Tax=marine sediment metagenome TaxID=412755 RepID=A0A0F8YS32_9ZZZZ
MDKQEAYEFACEWIDNAPEEYVIQNARDLYMFFSGVVKMCEMTQVD